MGNADYPEQIQTLILNLKRLPGIGPRSAQRIAIWLLSQSDQSCKSLAEALTVAERDVRLCPTCGFYANITSCALCDDKDRDQGLLCVVEKPADVLSIERSRCYGGLYHSLGGRLSPLDNIGPDDLHIEPLMNRLAQGNFDEVILAIGGDVEGEATAHYLTKILNKFSVKITRLAQGLPPGADLENTDGVTLKKALHNRGQAGG